MGLLQEAAIKAGDWVTQPIRARVVSIKTGRPTKVKKKVEQGALMGDGSIRPDLKPGGAVIEAFNTGKSVHVSNFHYKRVSWEIEFTDEE